MTTVLPVTEFRVVVGVSDELAELQVRGDLDVATAPELAAIVAALIDGGRRDLVIDLGEVDHLGAAGLGVLAAFAARLRAVGGTVTVRRPSTMTLRLLELTGLSNAVLVVGDLGASGPPSFRAGRRTAAVGSSAGDLARPEANPGDV